MERIADELEHSTARISTSSRPSRNIRTWTKPGCRKWTSPRAWNNANYHASQTQAWNCRHAQLRSGLAEDYGYGSELNQVWTNLIDNAADAMGENGKLRIRTARENDFILVEIADNGPGIPSEVKSRIFRAFFTTKGVGEGTGLGLDFVYRIVSGMHGQISVDRSPATLAFAVRIPIQAPQ